VQDDGTPNPGASQSITLYADTGSPLNFYVYRSGTQGLEYVNLTVCGYLVNVP